MLIQRIHNLELLESEYIKELFWGGERERCMQGRKTKTRKANLTVFKLPTYRKKKGKRRKNNKHKYNRHQEEAVCSLHQQLDL